MNTIKPHEVCWAIESLMFGEEYDTGMKAALESRGNPFYVISPMDNNIRLPNEFIEVVKKNDRTVEQSCVMFHGSIQTCAALLEKVGKVVLTPGAICNFDNFRYSTLLTHWGLGLLNNHPIFTTMQTLCNQYDYYFSKVTSGSDPVGKIFIRPDSGQKSFSGQLLGFDDLKRYQLARDAKDNEFVLVSAAQKIFKEWRVLIANGKVITGCQYRRLGVMELAKEFPPAIRNFAEGWARDAWQPDPIYMLDIGLIKDDKLKIIEANTFSCSDLYVMDCAEVVDAANLIAVNEWVKKG